MSSIQRRITTKPKDLPQVTELKFGTQFSDHWYHNKFTSKDGWGPGTIETYGKIEMDPAASVLHYGQALFEGMKAFRQANGEIVLFRPDFNYRRMQEGAARLCLEMPAKEIFDSALKELIQVDARWVPREEGCSLYIRPTLIGTEAFLGVRPAREILFFILLSPVGPYYARGTAPTRIWVEDKAVRAAPGGLGATKAGANYAASLYSGYQAKTKGYDQVLWLDVKHEGIEEVGTMNVFWVFKDEVVTPALNGSILAGGMRDSVLTLLRSQNIKVSERRITIAEVIERHAKGELIEAFGTGTAAVISPIGELFFHDKSYQIHDGTTGPLSQSLYKSIDGIQRGTTPDKFNWIQKLETL